MPYILLKRSDIPDGLLQNLDLTPNTSQRAFPYKKIGQTGYRVQPSNDAASLTAGVADETSAGLTAWMLSEVNDGTGAASTGTATLATVLTNDTFTITTAPVALFTAAATQTSGNLDFLDTATAGSDILAASSLVTAINDDANWAAVGIDRPVSADNAGGTVAVVTVTALADGTAGDYVLASSSGTIAVVGMAGGVDAGPITGAQAATNADDVLGLLAYDDAPTPAGALDLAAINGALTTGTVTAEQVAEILDVLAGRPFVLPQGAEVATGGVWNAGAGSFTDSSSVPGIRRIYETGSLRISFDSGRLSLMTADSFEFAGASGAAVVVYNDDGSLFVG